MVTIEYNHVVKPWIGQAKINVLSLPAYELTKIPATDLILVKCDNPDKLHVMMPSLPWLISGWVKDRLNKVVVESLYKSNAVISANACFLAQPFAEQFMLNVLWINKTLNESDRRLFWDI